MQEALWCALQGSSQGAASAAGSGHLLTGSELCLIAVVRASSFNWHVKD